MVKRLLFVSHSHKLEGGAEFSLLEIVKESKEKKYDCHVILPAKGTFSDALDTLKIHYSIASYTWSAQSNYDSTKFNPDIALVNADSLLEAYTIIKKERPDVVITNTIMPPWYAYVAKSLGIPNIMMIREAFDKRNSTRLLPTAMAYLDKLKSTIDFFLFNSHYTQGMYAKYLNSVPSNILYPIVKIAAADQPKLKQHASLNSKTLKMIIVGSIVEHKNQLEAVKALHNLIQNGHKSISLTIMGYADKKGYVHVIEKYISKHKLDDYITIKPFNANPLNEVVKHDVVITPSLSEAFGRVTLEGQLVGRVVIGCNSGGTKELIEHQHTGLLYNGGDESSLAERILWIMDHKQEAVALAKRGQKSAIKGFLTEALTSPFFSALESPTIKKGEPGNVCYDPLYALIQRNFHVNGILQTYADNLSNAIHTIEEWQTRSYRFKVSRIQAKVKRRIKRIVKN